MVFPCRTSKQSRKSGRRHLALEGLERREVMTTFTLTGSVQPFFDPGQARAVVIRTIGELGLRPDLIGPVTGRVIPIVRTEAQPPAPNASLYNADAAYSSYLLAHPGYPPSAIDPITGVTPEVRAAGYGFTVSPGGKLESGNVAGAASAITTLATPMNGFEGLSGEGMTIALGQVPRPSGEGWNVNKFNQIGIATATAPDGSGIFSLTTGVRSLNETARSVIIYAYRDVMPDGVMNVSEGVGGAIVTLSTPGSPPTTVLTGPDGSAVIPLQQGSGGTITVNMGQYGTASYNFKPIPYRNVVFDARSANGVVYISQDFAGSPGPLSLRGSIVSAPVAVNAAPGSTVSFAVPASHTLGYATRVYAVMGGTLQNVPVTVEGRTISVSIPKGMKPGAYKFSYFAGTDATGEAGARTEVTVNVTGGATFVSAKRTYGVHPKTTTLTLLFSEAGLVVTKNDITGVKKSAVKSVTVAGNRVTIQLVGQVKTPVTVNYHTTTGKKTVKV